MCCNLHPRKHMPVFFETDLEFGLINFVFGFSNGYLTNICYIIAPQYKIHLLLGPVRSVLLLLIYFQACDQRGAGGSEWDCDYGIRSWAFDGCYAVIFYSKGSLGLKLNNWKLLVRF